ncbi:MAG: GTPase Era [Candidatus Omnitrophica bacterium]|nr:GTPase Era [Candidatus Omnitrophota bacterium]
MTHRCGSVAIVGRPNVGKSTLLNRFLGQKIAIVSPKPETTRERLLGVLTLPNAQAIFIDTPGIYRGPKTLLGRHQIQAARGALAEADVVLMVTEGHAGITDEDRELMRALPRPGREELETIPAFLAINKVDRVRKEKILPQIDEARKRYRFRDIFPISATKGDNAEALLKSITEALPEGPPLYPPDQITDQPARILAQELIREKTLLFTHEEVPHAVAVVVEEWRAGEKSAREGAPRVPDKGPQHTYIRANLYVERESQKGILIGKGGLLLKKIGKAARREIEDLAGGPVYLDLWVKVAKDWRKDPQALRRMGYG